MIMEEPTIKDASTIADAMRSLMRSSLKRVRSNATILNFDFQFAFSGIFENFTQLPGNLFEQAKQLRS